VTDIQQRVPVVAFDHYDPEQARCPFPLYEQLRDECPIAHTSSHGGFWVASRYEDIRGIAHDTETFSSRHITVPVDIGFGSDVRIAPMHLDPPEHTRVKRLLASAFTPAAIKRMEPVTRAATAELLQARLPLGCLDASEDFARHVPVAVICEIFGVPSDLDRFSGWATRILGTAASDPAEAAAAAGEVFLFLAEVLAARRIDPGADILSQLTLAEINGEQLSDGEIIMASAALFLAGIDTTWAALGSSIHYLATHPDDQERLRTDPSLIPTAVEEMLRAFSPVMLARFVTTSTELHGVTLNEGDMVMLAFPAANRDTSTFPDADTVKLDRSPNPHIAFGSGIHRCVGSHVARLELKVALEELVRLVPSFQLADDAQVEWSIGPVRGPRRLPIVFEATDAGPESE
jgi:hypothetical protein